MNTKLISAAAIVAAFGAATAFAGEDKVAAEGDWQTKLEAKFAKIDVDANGAVSEAEYLEYKMAEAKAAFLAMAGDDGSVTLEEAKAAYLAEKTEEVAAAETESMDDGESGEDSDAR